MNTLQFYFENAKSLKNAKLTSSEKSKVNKAKKELNRQKKLEKQAQKARQSEMDQLAVYVHKNEINALKAGLLSDRDYLSIRARLLRHSNNLANLFSNLWLSTFIWNC